MANSVLIVGGPEGTPIPFEARKGYDTMVINGETKSVPVKYVCITDMFEYMGRSVEELRIFDYMFNRKGGGDGSTMLMTSPGIGPSVLPKTVFGPSTPPTPAFSPSPSISHPFRPPAPGFCATSPAFGGFRHHPAPGWIKMEFWVYGYPASPAFGTPFGPPVHIQPQRPLFCSSGSPRRSFLETPGATPAPSSGTFGSNATKLFSFGQTTQSGSLFGSKPPIQPSTQPTVNPSLASTSQTAQQKPLFASHETPKERSLFAFPEPASANDSGFNFDSTISSTSPAKASTNDDSQQPNYESISLDLAVLDNIIDFTKELLANETINSDPNFLDYVTKLTETLSINHGKPTSAGDSSIGPLDKDYNLPD